MELADDAAREAQAKQAGDRMIAARAQHLEESEWAAL